MKGDLSEKSTCYISMFFLFRWAGCICGSGYLCSFSCACSSCSAAPLALPAPAPVAAPAPAPVPTPGPAPAPAARLSHKRNYVWKAPGGSKNSPGQRTSGVPELRQHGNGKCGQQERRRSEGHRVQSRGSERQQVAWCKKLRNEISKVST